MAKGDTCHNARSRLSRRTSTGASFARRRVRARDDARDPVSLALIDALPEGSEFVGVEPRPTDPTPLRSLLYIEDGDTGHIGEYDMPESVWAWLRRFDKGDRVEPFEIVLTETEDE